MSAVGSECIPTPASGQADENQDGSAVNLYRQALKYFKDNEGKTVVLDYEVKLKLVAFTQQVLHGPMESADLPPLGAFDMIGKDRRRAWSALGKMTKEESMQQFAESVAEFMPQFKSHLEETKAQREQSRIKEVEALKRAAEEESRKAAEAETERQAEEQRLRDEEQRRKIQDALNRQTFTQFKAYAEQQYPSDPDRQAVLVRQLQEQHYRQYMQQVYQQQMESQAGQSLQIQEAAAQSTMSTPATKDENCCLDPQSTEMSTLSTSVNTSPSTLANPGDDVNQLTNQLASISTTDSAVSPSIQQDEESEGDEEGDVVEEEGDEYENEEYICDEEDDVPAPTMWTKKEIQDFKSAIKSEGGDSVLSIGHGETVTVRVPTHADGSALFWEFATDNYDVAFGLFFEWVDHDNETEISVHISDSEDEDLEDDDDEDAVTDQYNGGGELDPEHGGSSATLLANRASGADRGPPTSVVVPIYRRDCHQEVYAGTHQYPGKGIYLLKFDNSYSLWRSKTLYYRVYYTK